MSETCCDCKRPPHYDFHRRDGVVEPRCGAHAYPLLSRGVAKSDYAYVIVRPKGKR